MELSLNPASLSPIVRGMAPVKDRASRVPRVQPEATVHRRACYGSLENAASAAGTKSRSVVVGGGGGALG